MRLLLLAAGSLLLVLPAPTSARTWHITPDGTGDAPTIRPALSVSLAGRLAAAGYEPSDLENGTEREGVPPLPSLSRRRLGDVFAPTAVGLAFGAAGLLGGLAIGRAQEDPHGNDEPEVVGAAVGFTVLMPLGVHLGNRGRGHLGSVIAVSALSFLGGAMTLLFGFNETVVAVGTPLLQLGLTVHYELETARTGRPMAGWET